MCDKKFPTVISIYNFQKDCNFQTVEIITERKNILLVHCLRLVNNFHYIQPMATSLAIDISDEIKCPICLERLKQPKILPCQHTYCLECLEEVAKLNNPNTVDCPECRREYKVPHVSGVKGFPENRLMKFLLEKKKAVPNFLRSFSLKRSLSSPPTVQSVSPPQLNPAMTYTKSGARNPIASCSSPGSGSISLAPIDGILQHRNIASTSLSSSTLVESTQLPLSTIIESEVTTDFYQISSIDNASPSNDQESSSGLDNISKIILTMIVFIVVIIILLYIIMKYKDI